MFKPLLALLLACFAALTFAATEVNTASPAELDAIKGIGPATAAKIVDERKKAPFKDWNDLVSRVKGVGEKNSAEFSAAGLTVNGASMTGVTTAPAASKKASAKTGAPAPAAAVVAPVPAAVAAGSAPMTAADRKAAAKQERDDKRAAKKAAKAASAAQAASTPSKK